MRLAHLIEQYLFREPRTNVEAISSYCGVDPIRCREELAELEPFGVSVADDGSVSVNPFDTQLQPTTRRARDHVASQNVQWARCGVNSLSTATTYC